MLVRNDCRTDYRVLKQAHSLAKAGYAVTVVAMNPYGSEEREIQNGFTIIRVPVTFHRNKLLRGINLFPVTLWRMANVAKELHAEVYHAHDSDTVIAAWWAARQVSGAQLVYDAHEVGFSSLRSSVNLFGLPFGLVIWSWLKCNDFLIPRKFDAVISVNDVLADIQAAHYGITRPSVVMNCPPLYTSVPQPGRLAELAGISPNTPIVLYQGMLTRDRHGVGLENLVHAAALLRKGAVMFLGRGPMTEDLRALIQSRGISHRVKVLPAVPPNELLDYTSSACVGVIPTEPYDADLQYSSPNKLFEYLAVGLPVIYSDLKVIRDICEQYNCGILTDPRNAESMAAAIDQLLSDPALYTKLSTGAQRAAEIFNWEAQEQVLYELYHKLLVDAKAKPQ